MENIIKTFALYLGQEVEISHVEAPDEKGILVGVLAYHRNCVLVDLGGQIIEAPIHKCKLVLQPYPKHIYSFLNVDSGLNRQTHKIDNLRSRGFDIPCFYLDGKRPSEAGIAILKSNPVK